jgi:hypothetical protein
MAKAMEDRPLKTIVELHKAKAQASPSRNELLKLQQTEPIKHAKRWLDTTMNQYMNGQVHFKGNRNSMIKTI